MSRCCAPGDFDDIFSPAQATSDARRYRRKGLTGESRDIVREVTARGLRARTVLEVGGGIGALQIELLRAGAASTANVELSNAYEVEARRLLDDAGLADRATRRVANFVTDAAHVPAADVVVLQRVVCCYPDPVSLVGAAAAHARQLLVLTFPVDRPWTRIAIAALNVWPRIRGSRFRAFVHPTRSVVGTAAGEGMTLAERHPGPIWQMLVFVREEVVA